MDYKQFRERQHFFETEGGKIAYVDEGEGAAIVLVHGFPTSSWMFRNVIPYLVENRFRVIAPDLLGYGSSDKPDDPALYSTEKQGRRILALMQSLGIDRWTQVVHDMGGPWTWEIIDMEPEHLQKMVVTNTTAYVDGWRPPEEVGNLSTPTGAILLALLRNRFVGPRLGRMMFEPYVGHPEKLTPSVREGYWLPLHEGATRTARYFSRRYLTMSEDFPRYQAALKRLDIPAMLVWGKSDPALDCDVMTAQFARDLNIQDEQIHVFDDAKHFLWEDYPDEIAELIAGFAK